MNLTGSEMFFMVRCLIYRFNVLMNYKLQPLILTSILLALCLEKCVFCLILKYVGIKYLFNAFRKDLQWCCTFSRDTVICAFLPCLFFFICLERRLAIFISLSKANFWLCYFSLYIFVLYFINFSFYIYYFLPSTYFGFNLVFSTLLR